MLRISKLTDYGIVIMAFMAEDPARLFQATDIATHTHIAQPTVSKILSKLAQHKLIHSYRGIHGGYKLSRSPAQISVAALITALEGPIALTECNVSEETCSIKHHCKLRTPWQRINQVLCQSLESITLLDLAQITIGNP
ncbi:MAG: SUF system Fe-S cluster assembly regulator [Gammaproteobacteria bacterium]|nr:SUF system Fe-S cluster assembly regulator [Gammaproteobacteria bacterium]MBP9728982.1 SUF system Fe-S cluster assembly regulator [Gammaproteobacteria bacterium]